MTSEKISPLITQYYLDLKSHIDATERYFEFCRCMTNISLSDDLPKLDFEKLKNELDDLMCDPYVVSVKIRGLDGSLDKFLKAIEGKEKGESVSSKTDLSSQRFSSVDVSDPDIEVVVDDADYRHWESYINETSSAGLRLLARGARVGEEQQQIELLEIGLVRSGVYRPFKTIKEVKDLLTERNTHCFGIHTVLFRVERELQEWQITIAEHISEVSNRLSRTESSLAEAKELRETNKESFKSRANSRKRHGKNVESALKSVVTSSRAVQLEMVEVSAYVELTKTVIGPTDYEKTDTVETGGGAGISREVLESIEQLFRTKAEKVEQMLSQNIVTALSELVPTDSVPEDVLNTDTVELLGGLSGVNHRLVDLKVSDLLSRLAELRFQAKSHGSQWFDVYNGTLSSVKSVPLVVTGTITLLLPVILFFSEETSGKTAGDILADIKTAVPQGLLAGVSIGFILLFGYWSWADSSQKSDGDEHKAREQIRKCTLSLLKEYAGEVCEARLADCRSIITGWLEQTKEAEIESYERQVDLLTLKKDSDKEARGILIDLEKEAKALVKRNHEIARAVLALRSI